MLDPLISHYPGIDVFSPRYGFSGTLQAIMINMEYRLDLTPSSVHLKRRIWQETVSTLLFTDPETRIPKGQPIIYAQARDFEYPPYLLQFSGSPAERHAENLKVSFRHLDVIVEAKPIIDPA